MFNHEEDSDDYYSLPVISTNTGNSMLVETADLGFKSVFQAAEEELFTNNPQLGEWIGQILLKNGISSDEASAAVHRAVVITHEILRRQSETDAIRALVAPSVNLN